MNAGSLDQRVPILSNDEVGELAASFNAMAGRLEGAFTRQQELESSRKELIQAVSHDLRTPLASIWAMVESINDGVVADSATIRRYIRSTQTEVENLSRLINDLFDLAEMDSGVLELHAESALIQDLISDTLESMSAQALARRLTLKGSVEEELSPVNMDPQRVQRVLCNLVQNALRHTLPDGSVFIRATDVGEEVHVQVQDTGQGIPKAELPRIFQSYYRADPSRSRRSGGSGLGLNIALGIAEAHWGRIWAESTLGQGSTFTLPKAPSYQHSGISSRRSVVPADR